MSERHAPSATQKRASKGTPPAMTERQPSPATATTASSAAASSAKPDDGRDTTGELEIAANGLLDALATHFTQSASMSAVDIATTAAMNKSTTAFYAALQERLSTLLTSAKQAHRHANAARPFADDMTALLQKARRLEALVDRLDEYTARQEAALTRSYLS